MQKQENDENIDVDEELKKSKKERKKRKHKESKSKSSKKKSHHRAPVPSFPDDDTPLKVSSHTAITKLSETVVTKQDMITCNITGCPDKFFTPQGLIHHMKGAHRVDLEEKEKNTDQVDEIEAYLTNVTPATCSINEEITGDIATSTTDPVDTLPEKYCDDDPDDDQEAVDAFPDTYYEGDDGLGDEDDDNDQTGEGSQKNNPIEYQEEGAVTENKDGISESREKPFVKTVQEVAITNIDRKNVTDSMPIASVGVENSAPIHTSEASGILVIQEGSAKFEADRVTENKDGKIATSVTENKDGKSATRETVNICSSDMYPIDHGMGESIKEKCYVAYGTTEEPSEKLDEFSKPSLTKSDTLEQDDSTRISQHISEISVPEIPVMESEGRRTQSKKRFHHEEFVIKLKVAQEKK